LAEVTWEEITAKTQITQIITAINKSAQIMY